MSNSIASTYGFNIKSYEDSQAMGAQDMLRRKQQLMGAVTDPALDNSTRATLKELGFQAGGIDWKDPNQRSILGFLKDIKQAGDLPSRVTQLRGTAQELRYAEQVNKPGVARGQQLDYQELLFQDRKNPENNIYGKSWKQDLKTPFLSRQSDATGDLGFNRQAYDTSVWRKSLLGVSQTGVENTRGMSTGELSSTLDDYANTIDLADQVLNNKGNFKDYMSNLSKAFGLQQSQAGTYDSAAAAAHMAQTMTGVKTMLAGGLSQEMMDMPLDRPEQALLKKAGYGYSAENADLLTQQNKPAFSGGPLSAAQSGYTPGATYGGEEQNQMARGYGQLGAFVADRGAAEAKAGGASAFNVNQWEQDYLTSRPDLGAFLGAQRQGPRQPLGAGPSAAPQNRAPTTKRASLFYFNDQQGQGSGRTRTQSGAYLAR
jgi:hypothetical protein